jgi:hypothetical protein
MFASLLTAATPYCSVHGQLFIASLQVWLPLQLPPVHSSGDHPERTDVACPECDALALRTPKAPLPDFYTGA